MHPNVPGHGSVTHRSSGCITKRTPPNPPALCSSFTQVGILHALPSCPHCLYVFTVLTALLSSCPSVLTALTALLSSLPSLPSCLPALLPFGPPALLSSLPSCPHCPLVLTAHLCSLSSFISGKAPHAHPHLHLSSSKSSPHFSVALTFPTSLAMFGCPLSGTVPS